MLVVRLVHVQVRLLRIMRQQYSQKRKRKRGRGLWLHKPKNMRKKTVNISPLKPFLPSCQKNQLIKRPSKQRSTHQLHPSNSRRRLVFGSGGISEGVDSAHNVRTSDDSDGEAGAVNQTGSNQDSVDNLFSSGLTSTNDLMGGDNDVSSSFLDMTSTNEQLDNNNNNDMSHLSISRKQRVLLKLHEYLPALVDRLDESDMLYDFTTLMKNIAEGDFPMDNIALNLLMDLAHWFGLKNTVEMEYRPVSILFWKMGYRLFHGRFLRFMSGLKNSGQMISGECEPGYYDPMLSKVNFSVPSKDVLLKDGTIKVTQLAPGIIDSTLQTFTERNVDRTHVLCMDGKKVTPGLSDTGGDVDLFGFEGDTTVEEQKEQLQQQLTFVQTLKEKLSKMPQNLVGLPDESKESVAGELKNIVLIISSRLKDVRLMRVKKELGLEKFKKAAGTDWRNSKYLFIISSLQASLYQIDDFTRKALNAVKCLCHCISAVRGTLCQFTLESKVVFSSQENLIQLLDPERLPPELKVQSQFIKQRSVEWFALRKQARVTGSTIYNAIGLRTLKAQKEHFDKVIHNIEPPDHSPEVQQRLDHGTSNEGNALATLAAVVIPAFFPGLFVAEEGCYFLQEQGRDILEVSPDGSVRQLIGDDTLGTPVMAVEFKCPFPSSYQPPVHYHSSFPLYYITQLLAEMKALEVNQLIYLSYSEQSSTVFLVEFSENLWQKIWSEIIRIYGKEKPSRPQKLSVVSKELKEDLKDFAEHNICFLGEVPSIRGEQGDIFNSLPNMPYSYPLQKVGAQSHIPEPSIEYLHDALVQTEVVVKDGHQLARKKAVELLAWILSDTDRMWDSEVPNSLPVAYGLKDYSLNADTMRRMTRYVLDACKQKGIHVGALSFDGQWHKLMVSDSNGQPNTRLQHQKQVWEASSRMSKPELVKFFKEVNRCDATNNLENNVSIERDQGSMVFVASKDTRAFSYVRTTSNLNCWKNPSTSRKEEEDKPGEKSQSADLSWVPENFDSDPDFLPDLLSIGQEVQAELQSEPVRETSPDMSEIQHEQEGNTSSNGPGVATQTACIQSNVTSQDGCNAPKYIPSYENLVDLLSSLQANTVTANRWKDRSVEDLKSALKSAKNLNELTHGELNVIIVFTEPQRGHHSTKMNICKSWKKELKVNALSRFLGDGTVVTVQTEQRKPKSQNVKALKSIAAGILQSKSVPKAVLAVAHASYVYKDKVDTWENSAGISPQCVVGDLGKPDQWYFVPEVDEDGGILLKCTDPHHNLCNLRVKICKDGIQGIRKHAWHSVARERNTRLSLALVEDLVDKQSDSFARTTFSLEVELEMKRLGFIPEAEFCSLVRNWYEAHDSPGMGAMERCVKWLSFRDFLLRDVDFGKFPPPGRYVKGIPIVTYEGILCCIDSALQMYGVCKSGTFNVRTLGSLPAETFFSIAQDMDSSGAPTLRAADCGKTMATICEVMSVKANPNRGFYMTTSASTVYPMHPAEPGDEDEMQQNKEPKSAPITKIIPRDHFFDKSERRRTKGRHNRLGKVSSPNKPSRKALPVRQFHVCREDKILPTKRLGIDLQDI